MTLEEFSDQAWGVCNEIDNPPMIYVFDDEEEAKAFIRHKYYGVTNRDWELCFVLSSDKQTKTYLKDSWLQKK